MDLFRIIVICFWATVLYVEANHRHGQVNHKSTLICNNYGGMGYLSILMWIKAHDSQNTFTGLEI